MDAPNLKADDRAYKASLALKTTAPLYSELALAGVSLRSMPSPVAICTRKEISAARKESKRLSKAACAIAIVCKNSADQEASTPAAIRALVKELVVETADVAPTHADNGTFVKYTQRLSLVLEQLCPSAVQLFDSEGDVAWDEHVTAYKREQRGQGA